MNLERLRKAPNIAIIGSTSPLGKELRELLEAAPFPVGKLSFLETEEYAGLLQEFSGEIRITQIISPESFQDVDIAFFACGPDIINAYAASGSPFPELTIDLTQTRSDGTLFLSGISDVRLLKSTGYFINPHPAAIALARVLSRLHWKFGIDQASVTIMQPASERGAAGVDELQEQTVQLLNFQQVENRTFSGQLAFNLLPEIEASRQAEAIVRSQVAMLLGESVPKPGLAIIQAPVFHSHAFAMFVRLASQSTPSQVAECLEGGDGMVAVRPETEAEAAPVTVVGSDAVQVGRVTPDPNNPDVYFLWLVADNVRIAARNAIQIAESIMLAPASQR